MTCRPLLITFLLFCGTACAHVSEARSIVSQKPFVAGYDIYGTDRINAEEVRQYLGAELELCVDFLLQLKIENYSSCRDRISNKVLNHFHFAYSGLSAIQYFNQKNGNPVYVTFDVVEPSDKKVRMRFVPRPTEPFEDPDGLLKAWDDYLTLGFDLLKTNEITSAREDCPAFHCVFGHKHPKLAPFEKIFMAGVAKNESRLKQIFLNDKSDQHRGNAAFLLAYSHDGMELVKLLSLRMADESDVVRNNVMRVFSDISNYHRQITLPLDKVYAALEMPATTDRNKASSVILGKLTDPVEREKYRKDIMNKAVPIFLKTLRLKQPNNHDMAYLALKLLSGETFGEFDYSSWENWYKSAR